MAWLILGHRLILNQSQPLTGHSPFHIGMERIQIGGGGGGGLRKWEKIWNLILVEILELNAFTLTFSLYAILLPGPTLCSLSIQYEGISLSFAICCRCEVLLEFHPPIIKIRSSFSSISLYNASWRS